jgi:glycosyltransferase EpsE
MEKKPFISIILSTYNDGPELLPAIESILNQTFSNFELIICDDASTNGTFPLEEALANKDKRIVLLRNKENIGFCKSLNRCIDRSTGEYIARMDSDDISMPTRLEAQLAFLQNHPSVSVCGTNFLLFDEQGIWGAELLPEKINKEAAFRGNVLCHPSVLMKKQALVSVGKYTIFTQKTRIAEDYNLWCKFADSGFQMTNLPDFLFLYYCGEKSLKKRKIKYQIHIIQNKSYWRKRFHLSLFKNFIFEFRSLVSSFLPNFLYKKIRNHHYEQKLKMVSDITLYSAALNSRISQKKHEK